MHEGYGLEVHVRVMSMCASKCVPRLQSSHMSAWISVHDLMHKRAHKIYVVTCISSEVEASNRDF